MTPAIREASEGRLGISIGSSSTLARNAVVLSRALATLDARLREVATQAGVRLFDGG